MKRGCTFSLNASRTFCKSSGFRLPSFFSTYLLLLRKVTLNPSFRRVSAICARTHQCLDPLKGACSKIFGGVILIFCDQVNLLQIVIFTANIPKTMTPQHRQKPGYLSNPNFFKIFPHAECRYARATQKVCCLVTA